MKEIINIFGENIWERPKQQQMDYILFWLELWKSFLLLRGLRFYGKKRKERIRRNNENESEKGSNNNFVLGFFFLKKPPKTLERIWSIIDLNFLNFDFSNRSDFPVLFSFPYELIHGRAANRTNLALCVFSFFFLKSYDNWKRKRRRTPILHHI